MKQFMMILAAMILIPMAIQAQADSDVQPYFRGSGAMDINVGIGLGSTLTGTGLPFSASLGYGINENISVGGYLGFASTKQDLGVGTWNYTNIIIGGRGAYHHALVDNIDTYGGVMLGYNIASASWDGPGNPTVSVGGISYSGFVGARYHFTEKLGAYGEVGYGIAYLQFGLALKM